MGTRSIISIQWPDFCEKVWDQKSIFLVGGFLPVAIQFAFSEGMGELLLSWPIVSYPFVVMLNIFLSPHEDRVQGLTTKGIMTTFGLGGVLIILAAAAAAAAARLIMPTHEITISMIGMKETIYFWSMIIANGLTSLAMFLFDVRMACSSIESDQEERSVNGVVLNSRLSTLVLNLSLLTCFPSSKSTTVTTYKASKLLASLLFGALPWLRIGEIFKLKLFNILNIMLLVCSAFIINDIGKFPIRLLTTCLASVSAFGVFLVFYWIIISIGGLISCTWKAIKEGIERFKGKHKTTAPSRRSEDSQDIINDAANYTKVPLSPIDDHRRLATQEITREEEYAPKYEEEQSRPWISNSEVRSNEVNSSEDSHEKDTLRSHNPISRPSILISPEEKSKHQVTNHCEESRSLFTRAKSTSRQFALLYNVIDKIKPFLISPHGDTSKLILPSAEEDDIRKDGLRRGHRPLSRPSLIDIVQESDDDTRIVRSHVNKMISEIHEMATASSSVSSRGILDQVDDGKTEEINHSSDSVPVNSSSDEKGYMNDCLLYCSLLPADYEFTKDTLVWSWIAARIMNREKSDDIEGVARRCFDELIKGKYIVQSGYDRLSDQMRHKFVQETNIQPRYQRGNLDSCDTKLDALEHLSLIFEGIDEYQCELLRKCHKLKTLLMHRCYGSNIENLLNDLFKKLVLLTVLDLSCTDVEELPSSVENIQELRYLDMSHTPIRRLPESIDSLVNLETLLLLGCRNLFGLPIGMSKLNQLQNLAVDVARQVQLQSTLTEIGNLTNLKTLGTFPVGTKDGKRIGELGNLRRLEGSLCILKLENVLDKEEVHSAMLCNKPHLNKLQLLWSDLQNAKVKTEEEILENLRPHLNLKELEIQFYSGGVLPSWISDPSFTKITSITLLRCRYCERLPSFGDLPSLKFLSIVEMNGVVDIDGYFCRKQLDDQEYQCAFSQLEKLSFEGMSSLKSWTGVEDGDFPRLLQLSITYCPKLDSLPSRFKLSSPQHLEIIRDRPELTCLGDEGELPS